MMTTPLRQIRKTRALSLEEVAGRVGTNAGHLSRIERGVDGAGKALAERLVAYYGGEITEMEIFYPERFTPATPATPECPNVPG